jgi:hypothetical protein
VQSTGFFSGSGMVTDALLKWVYTVHTGDTVDGGPVLFNVFETRYCSYRVVGTVYETRYCSSRVGTVHIDSL